MGVECFRARRVATLATDTLCLRAISCKAARIVLGGFLSARESFRAAPRGLRRDAGLQCLPAIPG